MNNLLNKIKSDKIAAMKSGELFLKETLASILAAIKQVEVDTRKELQESDIIQILTKMVKQRQESITQFLAGNRPDLAEKEEKEKIIIEGYLPSQLSESEVMTMISDAIVETGASAIKDMSKVINLLRPKLTGRFDMAKVSSSVKALLS